MMIDDDNDDWIRAAGGERARRNTNDGNCCFFEGTLRRLRLVGPGAHECARVCAYNEQEVWCLVLRRAVFWAREEQQEEEEVSMLS